MIIICHVTMVTDNAVCSVVLREQTMTEDHNTQLIQ